MNLFSGAESALRSDGGQRPNEFHTSLVKLGVEWIVGRNHDGEAVRMANGRIDELAVITARNSRRVLTFTTGDDESGY